MAKLDLPSFQALKAAEYDLDSFNGLSDTAKFLQDMQKDQIDYGFKAQELDMKQQDLASLMGYREQLGNREKATIAKMKYALDQQKKTDARTEKNRLDYETNLPTLLKKIKENPLGAANFLNDNVGTLFNPENYSKLSARVNEGTERYDDSITRKESKRIRDERKQARSILGQFQQSGYDSKFIDEGVKNGTIPSWMVGQLNTAYDTNYSRIQNAEQKQYDNLTSDVEKRLLTNQKNSKLFRKGMDTLVNNGLITYDPDTFSFQINKAEGSLEYDNVKQQLDKLKTDFPISNPQDFRKEIDNKVSELPTRLQDDYMKFVNSLYNQEKALTPEETLTISQEKEKAQLRRDTEMEILNKEFEERMRGVNLKTIKDAETRFSDILPLLNRTAQEYKDTTPGWFMDNIASTKLTTELARLNNEGLVVPGYGEKAVPAVILENAMAALAHPNIGENKGFLGLFMDDPDVSKGELHKEIRKRMQTYLRDKKSHKALSKEKALRAEAIESAFKDTVNKTLSDIQGLRGVDARTKQYLKQEAIKKLMSQQQL